MVLDLGVQYYCVKCLFVLLMFAACELWVVWECDFYCLYGSNYPWSQIFSSIDSGTMCYVAFGPVTWKETGEQDERQMQRKIQHEVSTRASTTTSFLTSQVAFWWRWWRGAVLHSRPWSQKSVHVGQDLVDVKTSAHQTIQWAVVSCMKAFAFVVVLHKGFAFLFWLENMTDCVVGTF